ncbi:type III PLP-dependent enzyme domain-containing protein [Membranihabitans marinus]|uniref:arginine decarboxylase n=1 Tax=Membranihabitans marinus TaxID=1227546 RepID=UPI001F3B597C|nr:arginine decarboxylase [Membranihabitans marinus]
MKSTYFDLIDQTYYFPQEGFDLHEGELSFHGVSIMHLIKKYGTPFKLTYLPRIGEQIKKAKNLFNRSIRENGYKGKYYFCYCTKCCHFEHVIKKALDFGIHLETSSAFDVDIIYKLYTAGEIKNNIIIVHNGYKTDEYLSKIIQLQNDGFKNSIVVLDSMKELHRLNKMLTKKMKIGVRMAINEEPQSAYYTSRLGIRSSKIIDFYSKEIANMENIELTMLHFFVDTGIKDNIYYWGEFKRAIRLYTDLKKQCDTLNNINIGGGFPIRNNLGFEYDYKYMTNEIVRNIKVACNSEGIEEPNIFTEFGKYTVGESGATIFTVLEEKKQNDAERWYMIDNSLMNTIPDAWGLLEKFILLPINKWNEEYRNVNIGGISCDHSDYYNSEDLNQQVFLPATSNDAEEPLYVGFFHTGAYQDAISGYGGIKHCLIPSPKTIVIDRDSTGNYVDYVFRDEQTAQDMLRILGYKDQ